MILWRMQVGQRNVAEFHERLQRAEAEAPRRARRSAAAKSLRSVELLGHVRTPGAFYEPAVTQLMGIVLHGWAHAVVHCALRLGAVRKAVASELVPADKELLFACFMELWHAIADRRSDRAIVDKQRLAVQAEKDARRGAAANLGTAWLRGEGICLYAVFRCWHSFVRYRGMQRCVEAVHADQGEVQDGGARLYQELEKARFAQAQERQHRQESRDKLMQTLRHVQAERDQAAAAMQQADAEERAIETQYENVSTGLLKTIAELRELQDQTSRSSRDAEGFWERSMAVEAESWSMKAECEDEYAAAFAELNKLRQENVKARDRRQRDVKDARQQLRTKLSRQETAMEQMAKAHQDSLESMAVKQRRTEAVVARLRDELQEAAQTVRDLPVRVSELEIANANLSEEALAAERDLRDAEVAARERRQEYQVLLEAQQAAHARRKALQESLRTTRNVSGGSPVVSPRRAIGAAAA